MGKIALFAGTFDPITLGHEDIAQRAAKMFDKLIIGVGNNIHKKHLFTLEERVSFLQQVFQKDLNIEIITYNGLTIDFCKKNNISVIVRGVRNASDLDTENAIHYANKMLLPEIETIYIPTSAQYAGISSTAVREILTHNGDIVSFVPQSAYASIIRSFKSIK